MPSHKPSASQSISQSHSQNHRAQLANAYNELGKELSSSKVRVVGNYTLGKVIGEGAYGKVRMGTHRLTSTRVAIKQIPKAMSPALTREIHHHRQLHHPHITQMYEVIATESSIWIVTELCCGGELFDYLLEKGRLSEDETRVVFGQLCLAVAYLHENGIVHRDLKLENVLLDERCRVKLGDFGFTREFEQGSFMETFCGTTGYASPEMLQYKRYQGPEVDVWSLGVILYTLLTGTLPFDDDDEDIMRAKIIQGDFDDPAWLSLESRDLIKNILQKDVTKRFMIPQILSHPWFTSTNLTYEPDDDRLLSPQDRPASTDPDSQHSSDVSDLFNARDLGSPAPTTPDDPFPADDPFISSPSSTVPIKSPALIHHRNESESTLRLDLESLSNRMSISKPKTDPVPEEEPFPSQSQSRAHSRAPSPPRSTTSKAPPTHPARTPARTKRRSVSSTLSADNISPGTPLPAPGSGNVKVDFSTLLKSPCPVIFSTPQERELLNTMSVLGLDTAQIVHSVLTDACDSAGAVWWMLRKKNVEKAEDRDKGDGEKVEADGKDKGKAGDVLDGDKERDRDRSRKRRKVNIGVQTSEPPVRHMMPPSLSFVPPTPTTFGRPSTPPRAVSPTKNPMLSPSTSTVAEYSSRSHPSTPGGSLKDDREGPASGSISKRKARSGSVSIMQRATTALEAAGLVRKRSAEAVKDKDKDKDKDKERLGTSGEESRSSHGSGGSSKLTKSPPLKAKDKEKEYTAPRTPPPSDPHHSMPQIAGSPWVLADSKEAAPEMVHSHSTPNISTDATPTAKASGSGSGSGTNRNRANILTAFRLWFNEDRKGKRKDTSSPNTAVNAPSPPIKYTSRPVGGQQQYGTKRRGSGSGSKFRSGHRAQRPSLSSRRSSSVNSRRSSGTSVQMIMLDSPQVQTRRSLGAHTPNSERGEYSSRPSSVRSFSLQPRHRKSPSASSAGSISRFRAPSPMQSKYHRRGGSGSSTRVVRQIQTNVPRAIHARSNSATSSIHSPPSSRPTSFYDPSESDGPRTGSPYKSRSRRSTEDTPRRTSSGGGGTTTTFVAQKRQGPFMSPVTGRSSWKKSWGLEPPGWQTRMTHLPVEVLAMSPATEVTSVRDVFSGRQSLSLGDESDWVDEDDDIPAFAGGLGQLSSSAASSSIAANTLKPLTVEPTVTLSPAPRGFRSSGSKRSSATSNTMSGRQKASPVERVSPGPLENNYDTDSRAARRSLPAGRAGPAFKHPIQEEDEDEEEE